MEFQIKDCEPEAHLLTEWLHCFKTMTQIHGLFLNNQIQTMSTRLLPNGDD